MVEQDDMRRAERMAAATARLAAVMAAHQRDLKLIERLEAEGKALRAIATTMGIDPEAGLKRRGIIDVVLVSPLAGLSWRPI